MSTTYEVTSPDGKVYEVTAPEGATQDQILAYAKSQLAAKPEQDKGRSSLPANAGLASFGSSVVGLPVDTIENAVNLGIAGYGTAATALGRPDLAPDPIRGSFGGSESIRQGLRATGIPGLSPDNPNPESKFGTTQYEFTRRGGFIPGGVLPAAGSMIAEKMGGPQWGTVGALTPQAAISGYNAMRAPSLARQEAENAIRDQTLRAARNEGYIVPPSSSGGGFLSRRLESIGGKAAVGQEAAARNQKITNELAREELGLPKSAPLTEEGLKRLRDNLAAPYREVAMIDPEASAALKDLKQARFDANDNFKFYAFIPNPEILAKAKSFQAKADQLEKYLEDIATNAGKPSLVNELRDARRQIAKTYDVERALNVGTGDVAARILGKALDQGRPLSGGLAMAGKFAEAFPSYAREGATIPTPSVSKSEALAAAFLGFGGFAATGSPYGAAAAALPLMSGPARSLVLSNPYQNAVMPNYRPALSTASPEQLLYQLGIFAQPQ